MTWEPEVQVIPHHSDTLWCPVLLGRMHQWQQEGTPC